MQVYNSLSRSKEELRTIEPGHVKLYTCGPTVYNFAHIGNFRAYTFEDVLRRALLFNGFRVTQVMNLTDVDDKTIRGSLAAGVPLKSFTQPYIQAFFDDLKTLNIQPAEHYPAATDHIAEMIALVAKLFERGLAYTSEDGSVYFSVGKLQGYGKLAHLDRENLRAGARVAQDEYEKESYGDFALWKGWDASDGDVVWESPWGRGRPGWHLECSAMSLKYLGSEFDIHGGGLDLRFPHHENELAQSRAAGHGFAKYWMHNAFVTMAGEKMSKSLGNSALVGEVTRQYEPRAVRLYLVAPHYRSAIEFSPTSLTEASAQLARIDSFLERAGASGPVEFDLAKLPIEFVAAMDDDLGTPAGVAVIFDIVKQGNRAIDAGDRSAAEESLGQVRAMLHVLGLDPHDPVWAAAGGADLGGVVDGLVDLVLAQRSQARARKDWATADAIRDQLAAIGLTIEDTPEGVRWSI